MNNSYGDDLENQDILGPVADEFSIKTDITVKKKAQNNKLKKSQATLPKQDPQFQAFNYKNLKNNYLYKLPTKPADLN